MQNGLFEQVKDHVLSCKYANRLEETDALFHSILNEEAIDAIYKFNSREWLEENDSDENTWSKKIYKHSKLKNKVCGIIHFYKTGNTCKGSYYLNMQL